MTIKKTPPGFDRIINHGRSTVYLECDPLPGDVREADERQPCRIVAVLRSENNYLDKHFLIQLDNAGGKKKLARNVLIGERRLTTDDFMRLENGGMSLGDCDLYRNFDVSCAEVNAGLHLRLEPTAEKK